MGKNKILVIGDWFIDENWLMAKTDNYHSTDVGEAHYSSLIKGPGSFVLSLCGVASVLKILSGNWKDADGPVAKSLTDTYELVGVGAWNPRDTEIIQRILCARKPNLKFMTPFTLANDLQKFADGCPDNHGKGCAECSGKKYNLINLVKDGLGSDESVSTNRIYRIYEGFGSDKPKLRYRFDWQIDLNKNLVQNEWHQDLDNVKAVIIVDHGKGAITDELIDVLINRFKDANWYVRNKLKSPSWFKRLIKHEKKLKLLVIDQQLVNHIYGERKWHRNGRLCRASLELLGELLGLKTFEHGAEQQSSLIASENAAVLFEDNWAIGGTRKKISNSPQILENQSINYPLNSCEDARIYYFPRLIEKERYIRVGRTSIFFNSLIFWDLIVNDLSEMIEFPEEIAGKRVETNETQLSSAIKWALQNMEKWMDQCTEAWREERDQALSGPFSEVIGWHPYEHKMINSQDRIIGEDYIESWNEWNQSSCNQGIINISGGELHLWRSYGTLDNYVCPGGVKRSSINGLVRSLKMFRQNPKPSTPFNTLLIAEPGWGKSFLAKCLSTRFDFDFLSYSIAQMSSTKELVDSFKEISSVQKQSNKKCLVFMDEIDAEIAGERALGLLLSPMWDGIFKSEGYTNKIDPCIWIFACTSPQSRLLKFTKGRDFLSRINGPVINIDFLDDESRSKVHKDNISENDRERELISALCSPRDGDDRRTEIVYQTVNFLNREYGPIAEIEKDVLNLFSKILPLNGVRSLQIFVSKFDGIKKGVIRRENVPKLKDNPEMEKQIRLLSKQEFDEIAIKRNTVKIRLNVTV